MNEILYYIIVAAFGWLCGDIYFKYKQKKP